MLEKYNKDLGGDSFYCYSRRLALFIRSMGVFYEEINTHPITGAVYTKFPKSVKLTKIIRLWDNIKFQFDNMNDDGTVVIHNGENINHH